MCKWIVCMAFSIMLCLLLGPAGAAQETTQYIYVPLEEWDAVIAKEGKGVWLSFEDYLALNRPMAPLKPSPVIVNRVEHRAKVIAGTLCMETELYLTSLADGPEKYNFPFGSFGMARATLNGEDAPLTVREIKPQKGVPGQIEYTVSLPNKGEHRLVLLCYQRLEEHRDELKARIMLGKFPQQTFRLKTEAELEYTTSPAHRQAGDDLIVDLGSASEIAIAIRPREKKDVKQPGLIAHIYGSHLVDADSLVSCFEILYEIHHRPQRTFYMFLPRDGEIISISEKRWEIAAQGPDRILTLQLDEEKTGTHRISIKCRRQLLEDGDFDLPKVTATGEHLISQEGITYIEKSPDIQLKGARPLKGVRQINHHALGEGDASLLQTFGREPFLACRFWDEKYDIRLHREIIVPEIESTFISAVTIYPEVLESVAEVTFHLMKGKVKMLKIQIPEGWNLARVHTALCPVDSTVFSEFPVPDFYVENNILYLPLPRKISRGEKCKASLLLQYNPQLWDGRLQSWNIRLPLIKPLESKYQPSFLGVIADPDYKIVLAEDPKPRDIKSVDIKLIRSLKIESDNLQLGFKTTSQEAEGTLTGERRQPQIFVDCATYLAMEAKRTRCAMVLAFDIKNASCSSFSFEFPSWFKDFLGVSDEREWPARLHIADEKGYMKEPICPKNGDKKLKWRVDLNKKVSGSYCLYLYYEVPLRPKFSIPPITVTGENLQLRGVIGIAASSEAEIKISRTDELKEMPVKRLPIFYHPQFPLDLDFLHAFEYSAPAPDLSLDVRFHKKADVPSAILTEVKISTFLIEPGRERVYCEYHLSPSELQFFKTTLPEKSEFWSAVVNGKGEKVFAQNNTVAIPLASDKTQGHIVTVVYERGIEKLGNFGTLRLYRPESDPNIRVKRLNWKVYVPMDYRIGRDLRALEEDYWYEQIAILKNYAPELGSVQEKPTRSMADEKAKAPQPARRERRAKQRAEEAELPASTETERYDEAPKQQAMLEKEPALSGLYPQTPGVAQPPYEESLLSDKEKKNELTEGRISDDVLPPEPDLDQTIAPHKGDKPLGKVEGRFGGKEKDRDKESKATGEEETPEPEPVEGTKAGEWAEEWEEVIALPEKAPGLRSLELTVFGDLNSKQPVYHFSVYEYSSEGSRELSPAGPPSLDIAYVKVEAAQSLEVWLYALATIAGLALLLTLPRIPRVPAFIALILVLTFIPRWFGSCLIPYCNALVWGLFLSALFVVLYKTGRRLGNWLSMRSAALVALALIGPGLYLTAQPTPDSGPKHIYIPYNPETSGKIPEVKDVFVPYNEYVRLWNLAFPDRKIEIAEVGDRVDYILYGAHYEKIGNDVKEAERRKLEFSAQFLIAVINGPVEVPVGLKDVAVVEAWLYDASGNQSPLILRPTEDGYTVILPAPGRYRIAIRFLPKVHGDETEGSLGFDIVPVATAIFKMEFPKVSGIALPEFRGQWLEEIAGDRKTITLFPGAARRISIRWFPEMERYRVEGLEMKATHEHELLLCDQLLTLKAKIHYKIEAGKCDRLNVRFPRDYTILALKCDKLDQWILSEEADYNEIIVRLKESQQKISLEFTAQKSLGSLPAEETFPNIAVTGVTSEEGKATLISHNAYNAVLEPNPTLLASASREDDFSRTFSYPLRHQLVLKIDWQKTDNWVYAPRKNPEGSLPGISVLISEEKVAIVYQAQIEVKGKPIFSYDLLCPSEFEVKEVLGQEVKSWRVEPAGEQQKIAIVFQVSIPTGKRAQFEVRLEKRVQFEVRPEKGQSGEIFSLPYFDSPQMNHHAGTVFICCVEDLLCEQQETRGLNLYEKMGTFTTPEKYTRRYAYSFTIKKGERPYEAKFMVQRKKPEIEVTAVVELLVEDYWLNWAYYLNYHIRFAGVDTFTFLLPAELGTNIEILGDNIREKKEPKERGEYLEWTVVLHNKVREQYALWVFPELKRTPETLITVPPIRFYVEGLSKGDKAEGLKLIRQSVYVRVENSSSYKLNEEVKGLERLKDAKILDSVLPQSPSDEKKLTRAIYEYRMSDPNWQLSFAVHKPELVHTIPTVVEAIWAQSVIAEEGEVRHRIVYCIKYGGLQFLELSGLEKAKIWGTMADESSLQPVKRQVGEKEHILIPLNPVSTREARDQKLLVTLLYSENISPLVDDLRLVLPNVVNIEEIGDFYWNVYLPEDYIYKFKGSVNVYNPEEYRQFSQQQKELPSKEEPVSLRYVGRYNALQSKYPGQWAKEELSEQEELERFSQTTTLMDNAQLNQKYERQNMEDLQRAGQYIIILPETGIEKNVYEDKRDAEVMNEPADQFLQRQEKKAEEMINQKIQQNPGESQEESGAPDKSKGELQARYDLYIPPDFQCFTFSKKQGKAEGESTWYLDIQCSRDPRQSKFWIAVQFLGFLALLVLAIRLRLLKREEGGYGIRKVWLLFLVGIVAIAWCFFLDIAYLWATML